MNELTKSQLRRQDFVDNEIHWMLTHLASDINGQHMWNIEDIAKVREVALSILYDYGYNTKRNNGEMDFRSKEEFEMEFYPYIEEDEDDFERDWCNFCQASCVADGDNNCPKCGLDVDMEVSAGDYTECQSCHSKITWELYQVNTGLCTDCSDTLN